jgi:hypothetical protein
MVMLVVACLLLLPAELLPHNDPREIDIGVFLSLDCPDDIVQSNDLGVCSAVVWYAIPTGCYVASGPQPGSTFPVGVTTIQINLDDDSDSCTFTVTVNDTEAPVFTFCPGDIIQSYDAGICQTVEYEFPEAEDNCELDNIYLVSGLSSGSIFPIGETTIVYAAEDTSNNISYCSFSVTISGGHTSVLASDGSSSEVMAPQGGLRYQRAFFLLTPEEMDSSDLSASTEINSIGFTIGVAQEDTSKGHLKVYLQNTYDTISRIDSTWSTATTGSNSYTLSGIDPGAYEWQVKSLCSSSSEYSQIMSFANDDLGGCNQPFNLETENITETSVKFVWELPVSSSFDSLLIVYGITLSDDSDSAYTTAMYYEATALTPDTNYQWSVRTICNGNESPISVANFSTESPDVCDEPSDLALGTITDSTAEVSWLAASGASYYYTAIRRLGSSNWVNAYSFSDTYTFAGLLAGTTYEWKVKTICPDGSGAYVTGPDITIPGTLVCYTPEDLKTSNISTTAATLSWLEVPGAGSYEIKYRLKESISWNNAINGMTLASDGPVTIPDTIGPYDIPFEPGSLFTYDGNGLYVAWEYSRPIGLLSTPNTSLCTKQNSIIKDTNGILVQKLIKSFVGKTDSNSTALPATLKATDLRPETRLGSPSLQDSLEVTAVYTLGYVAIPYGSPVPISAMIKNFSDAPKTITVTLSIFDGETNSLLYTIPQDLDLPASCGELISFPDWIHNETGKDSIVVSVPVQTGENVVDNNSKYYLQRLNNFIQSYDDGTPVINGAGFGSGDGLILSRFSMNGCGKINAAKVYLHWSAADNPLYAVLLDESGTILDISSQYTADSTEVNDFHSFYFPNTPLIIDNDYYIGLAQMANPSEAYEPVGVQWEGSIIREGAYYRADLDGSNIIDHPYPGRLMIKAEILPGMPVPFISGSDILCAGSTNTLQAASKTSRFADSVIAVSSEYSSTSFGAIQALGSPDVYPDHNPNPNAWISETSDSQREYIELHFPDTARINFIDIYQTFNPGAIDTVYVIDSLWNYHMVYADTAQAEPPEASILEIRFPLTSFRVSQIRIEISSDSIPGYQAIDAVGIGQINDPATFDTYSWDPGGETTQSIDVTSPDDYKLTVSYSSSCTLSDSIEVTTPTLTVPTISLSGPIAFCLGDSVVLTSSETGNNTWSTGETTDSITVGESGTYNVTYDNGCETATSSDVVVTVHPLPEVNITGGPICPGESTLLYAGAGYTTYLWSTDETTPGILVSTPGEYEVTVTDDNGCEGSGSVSAFFTPSPTPSISGDPYFCPGDSTLLDAGYGYSAYLWSTGETTRQIYVGTTGLVSVTVTNEYGCTGSTSVSTGEYTPPQPFISGALSLCFGSVTVLDAGEGYASYYWSTGEITNSIVVDTADTFTVTVTDDHGCKGSASATTNLDGAIPEVPGQITGPAGGVCQQSGLVYFIDPLPNTTHYVWTVPEGMIITAGQGSNEITVDADILTTGIISVAASNTCGQSPTWNGRTLEVHGTPDVPGEITGQENGVCGLSGLTYSIDAVYGVSSYNWTVPAGAAITSGNGTLSITVSFDVSFATGYICVGTTNDCGTSEDACLLINSIPAMPAEIFGPAQVCRKEKNVEYTVDPVFNVDTYIWTVPLQASIKSGQGTASIIVDFGNKSGFITVQTENDCGLSSIQTLAVDVVPCDNGIVINIPDPSNNNDPLLDGGKHIFFPEVIASAGGFSYGEVVTLSWTLGESVIETVNDDRMMLTQGFQQSYYEIIALGGVMEGSTFEVEVYPVPTRDNVHIHITSDSEPVNLVVELYDVVGTMLFKENVKSKEFNHQISLNQYPAKMFILKVIDVQNNYERTFKIIKVRF